jgi:hypothetical protein
VVGASYGNVHFIDCEVYDPNANVAYAWRLSKFGTLNSRSFMFRDCQSYPAAREKLHLTDATDAAIDITVKDGIPREIALTSNANIALGQTGTVITNQGAVAEVILTLPSRSTGAFTFVVKAGSFLRIAPSTGGRIYGTSAINRWLRSSSPGARIAFESDKDMGNWYITNLYGTWTEGP